MNKSNKEQQAREAWQKYTHKNQKKFWQYYEHLLTSAKQEQQARKVSQPPVAQVKPSPSPKEDPLVTGKKFILKIIALLILIFAYVSLQPEYHTGESTVETLTYEEKHKSIKEQWLEAMSTPDQRADWKTFRVRNETVIPRKDMVNQFIRQHGLIDWSQAPTNMVEHLAIYHLFSPGDTSIVVKKQSVGNEIKFVRYDSTLKGMPPSTSFLKARLVLVYNNHPVIVKSDGYYIKPPYQTKAAKVVKGGELLLKLKIIVEQLP